MNGALETLDRHDNNDWSAIKRCAEAIERNLQAMESHISTKMAWTLSKNPLVLREPTLSGENTWSKNFRQNVAGGRVYGYVIANKLLAEALLCRLERISSPQDVQRCVKVLIARDEVLPITLGIERYLLERHDAEPVGAALFYESGYEKPSAVIPMTVNGTCAMLSQLHATLEKDHVSPLYTLFT